MKKSVLKPELNWLSNPEVFRVNRMDAHSDHFVYESEEAYKNNKSSLFQSLNGQWDFAYANKPAERMADFYKMDFSTEKFDKINVPGHIQLQGYDRCQYINTMYPWDGREEMRPPQVSEEYNPVGSYVKYFDLDNSLLDKNIILSFQGVEVAFYVWVNGEFVGYSEDTFTPSEFDITDFVPLHSRGEVGIAVHKDYRQRGYATDALKLLCEYAFDFLSLSQLYAHVMTDNEVCVKLFTSCGFVQCGLLKNWLQVEGCYKDALLLQCLNPKK